MRPELEYVPLEVPWPSMAQHHVSFSCDPPPRIHPRFTAELTEPGMKKFRRKPFWAGADSAKRWTTPPAKNKLGWLPREQKILKGHLPRVIYHQVYED